MNIVELAMLKKMIGSSGNLPVATDEEVVEMIAKSSFVDLVIDETGYAYTDNNENILVI